MDTDRGNALTPDDAGRILARLHWIVSQSDLHANAGHAAWMAIIGIVDNAAAVLEACLDDRIHDWFEPGPGETVETVLAGIRGRLSHVEPTADIDGPSLLRVVLAVQALDLAHRVTPVPVGYP